MAFLQEIPESLQPPWRGQGLQHSLLFAGTEGIILEGSVHHKAFLILTVLRRFPGAKIIFTVFGFENCGDFSAVREVSEWVQLFLWAVVLLLAAPPHFSALPAATPATSRSSLFRMVKMLGCVTPGQRIIEIFFIFNIVLLASSVSGCWWLEVSCG